MKSSIWKAAWTHHRDHFVAMLFVTFSIVTFAWVLMELVGAALFVWLFIGAPLMVSWVFIARQFSQGNRLHARAIYFGYRNFGRSMLTGIYLLWPPILAFFLSYLVISMPIWLIVFRDVDMNTIAMEELLLLTTTEQLYAWVSALPINMTEFLIALVVILSSSFIVALFFYGRRQFSIIASMDASKTPLPAIDAVLKLYVHQYRFKIFFLNAIGWIPIVTILAIMVLVHPIPTGTALPAQILINGIAALAIAVPYKIFHLFVLTEWYDKTILQALKQTQPIPPETPIT